MDGHFAGVQALDEQIEALEDLVFDERPRYTDVQRRSFELRKSLVQVRRVVLPMREVVNAIMRRDLHVATVTCSRTSRTSTTTCCVPPSGRSRCGTWSPRSARRSSTSRATASTRS
ncbi:CorA family divalent cation transporter [Amycolatopsis sp. lyj-23]|uniref:CorA family divalent cation transporter n=1 Tax=Amycolatopsis sp. lyj-23 TaxID=2789283 RepID=UPI00397B30AC